MSTVKLGDDFLRIPKLDTAGTNFVIYKDRFLWSIDARGLLDHLDGTGSEPVDPLDRSDVTEVITTAGATDGAPVIETTTTVPRTLTADETLLDTDFKQRLATWRRGEAIVKQQIAGTIPDSVFMKIRNKGTAFEIWRSLEGDYTKRSRMVSVDFAKLRTMREDLAAMGHPPAEDDFYAIILGSLPPSFDPYISAVNATSSVLGTTLSADELMATVTEEYERRILKTRNGKKEDNAAFYSNDSGKGRKGGSSSKKNVECFNCHKKGHYKADCWAEGGGKEGEGPNSKGKGKAKPKEAAASAKAKADKDDEEAWMAMVMEDCEQQIWMEKAGDNVADFMEEGLNFMGLASDDDGDVSSVDGT